MELHLIRFRWLRSRQIKPEGGTSKVSVIHMVHMLGTRSGMAVEWAQLSLQTKEPTDCFIIGLYFCITVVVLEGEYVRGLTEREHPKITRWIWQSDNVSSAALYLSNSHRTTQIQRDGPYTPHLNGRVSKISGEKF